VRIVFFGTPEFAASILEHVVKTTHHEIVAVVSKPDAPKGRGRLLQPTPVKVMAQNLLPSIPIFQPEKVSTPEFEETLKGFSPDVFLVVAYGELIKSGLLAIPRLGCYNIHASLLPAYRGAAPIQRALIDGRTKTGITIFRLTKGMDSGDMVWRMDCDVNENMNAGELTDILLMLAKRGSVETLDLLETGRVLFTPQHHEEATFAPKITPEDLVLDQQQEVTRLHDRIRALSPHPGAYFLVSYRDQKLRLKVNRSHIDASITDQYRRWIILDDGSLGLSSPLGTLILDQVQLEGRACMDSASFLRGIPLHQLLFL
jgi:methionyl-tRNA formyltransferase